MGLLIIALLLLPQAKLAVGRVVRLRPPKPASLTLDAGRRRRALVAATVVLSAPSSPATTSTPSGWP